MIGSKLRALRIIWYFPYFYWVPLFLIFIFYIRLVYLIIFYSFKVCCNVIDYIYKTKIFITLFNRSPFLLIFCHGHPIYVNKSCLSPFYPFVHIFCSIFATLKHQLSWYLIQMCWFCDDLTCWITMSLLVYLRC